MVLYVIWYAFNSYIQPLIFILFINGTCIYIIHTLENLLLTYVQRADSLSALAHLHCFKDIRPKFAPACRCMLSPMLPFPDIILEQYFKSPGRPLSHSSLVWFFFYIAHFTRVPHSSKQCLINTIHWNLTFSSPLDFIGLFKNFIIIF